MARAREVFKLSTDSARHLVSTEKKIQFWAWGSLGGASQVVFFWPTLPGPGRQSNGPIFCLNFFVETRLSSESLEPLIGFLAYLDAKLYHKIQKVVKISTTTKESWVE